METPPCSSARRVGWFPSGAYADTPSGVVRPGGFSAVRPRFTIPPQTVHKSPEHHARGLFFP
jgi:hypothetical protein